MVLNGNFDTGSLTNWSVVGNADVVEGSASLNNDFGSAPDNVVENFLNLTPGTLDGITNPFDATTGSAIESSAFQVNAGEILSFDWQFTTNEGTGSFFNDFSFFSIDSLSSGTSAEANLLADTNGPFGPQTSTYNFQADGYYQVGFGVLNQVDPVVSSELLLDNVRFLNTGFETGDFTDWFAFGNATVQTPSDGTIPPEGISQALLSTDFGAISDANIEAELGLSTGALDSLGNGNATEGSAIELTPIDVQAGDILSFSWDFLTGESTGVGTFFNDFAFVSIVDESGNSLLLNTLDSASLGATPGYDTFNYTFDTSGTFAVSLGVLDAQDTAVASTLLVDNLLLL